MDHSNPYAREGIIPVAHSSSSSVNISSPTVSTFSRGHSSKGSASSIASSPIPRESMDMYGSVKRLEDVTEEPHEKDEFEGYTLVDDSMGDLLDYRNAFGCSKDPDQACPNSSVTHCYPASDEEAWNHEWLYSSTARCQPISSPEQHTSKRPRSMEPAPPNNSSRFSGRLGSISRRWRNRTIAGPQLSIVTYMANSPASRSSSLNSMQILSPALSAISKHESMLSTPSQAMTSESSLEMISPPIDIKLQVEEQEEEPAQATTPLLPPVLAEMLHREEPVQSPLQSPSIAPTSAVLSSRPSFDTPPLFCLPSPPLSTRPSMVSMHNRSRTNTITNDIPPLQLLEDPSDPWAVRLGHANFSIHPEPYVPDTTSLDSYVEYRENWNQARTNYAKHVTRTAEHYGSTSKVYKLTEEKWAGIDAEWNSHHTVMKAALATTITRLSNGSSEMQNSTTSSALLEIPADRMILPDIDDKTGKFPQLGDGEIVGPMSVARPRALTNPPKPPEMHSPPPSPRKPKLRGIWDRMFHN